jgi:acyl carrier protein
MSAPPDAEILAGIEEVARRHLRWSGPIDASQRLVETLALDSLRLLTLLVEVESRFRVRLDEGADGGIETVGDLVRAIRSELDEPTADPD